MSLNYMNRNHTFPLCSKTPAASLYLSQIDCRKSIRKRKNAEKQGRLPVCATYRKPSLPLIHRACRTRTTVRSMFLDVWTARRHWASFYHDSPSDSSVLSDTYCPPAGFILNIWLKSLLPSSTNLPL